VSSPRAAGERRFPSGNKRPIPNSTKKIVLNSTAAVMNSSAARTNSIFDLEELNC